MRSPWFGRFARSLLRSIAVHVSLTTLAAILLFSVVDFVEASNLAVDWIQARDLLELSLSRVPSLIRLLLPVCAPMGAMTAVAGYLSRSEIAALFAAGGSPATVLKPVAAAALLMSLVYAANTEWLVPPTRARVDRVRARVGLRYDAGDLLGRNRSWFRGKDKLFRVRTVRDAEAAELADVLVLSFADGRLRKRWDIEELRYHDGEWTGRGVVERSFEPDESGRMQTARKAEERILLSEEPEDFIRGIAPAQRLSYEALSDTIAALDRLGLPSEEHRIERHLRIAGPLTLALIFCAAAALALRLRGRPSYGTALVAGATMGFGAWVCRELGNLLGSTQTIGPFPSAYAAAILAAVLSAWAVSRAFRLGIGRF